MHKLILVSICLLSVACAPKRGWRGAPGDAGSSCSVSPAVGGAVITCTNGSTSLILNGLAGMDGADGADAPPTPYTVTELINPGGINTAFDEVLFRLASGEIVAHYSSGALQFLTVLAPGNYQTTDAAHTPFTVGPAPAYLVSW